MKRNLFWLVILVLSVAGVLQGKTLPAEIKEVSLFKNGLGYFVYEVTVADKEKSFTIEPPAAASHGTFWLSYSDKVKLKSFVAKEIEVEKKMQAINVAELLKANVGQKVKLVLDKDEEIQCTIKYFAQERVLPHGDPYAPGRGDGSTRDNRYIAYEPSRQAGNLMIIQTQAGEMCLNADTVKRVEFTGGTAEKSYTGKTKDYQLEVTLAEAAKGQKLVFSQLSKGITWVPSYIVDISDAQNASISAKAEIINEVCDLEDVSVQLITGYPHLQFGDIVSPMAMKEDLAQFLQSLISGESERTGSKSNVMRQMTSNFALYKAEEKSGMMPAYGAAVSGKTAEDLFFYPLEKVNLSKDGVGYFPLFTEKVPYKHIYKWDIPDYINTNERYYNQQEQPESKEEVWHCVRLDNAAKVPWTTGPAQTVKDGLILGQDTLNYTPTGVKSTLRITQAVNVKAEQAEIETERKRDAARFYDDSYDLVTVKGKLAINNMQAKAVTVEITKNLTGELKASQPEATVEKQAKGLKNVNTSLKLTWNIDLKQGERKELEYTYEVYVRR